MGSLWTVLSRPCVKFLTKDNELDVNKTNIRVGISFSKKILLDDIDEIIVSTYDE